jgi:hypothetical protein
VGFPLLKRTPYVREEEDDRPWLLRAVGSDRPNGPEKWACLAGWLVWPFFYFSSKI